MGKKHFTEQQVLQLKENPYVLKVSQKAITYTDKFKEVFIKEYNEGNLPHQIFSKHGFDTEVLGSKRISTASHRWRNQMIRVEGISDTRKNNEGRPVTRHLTQEELMKKLQDKIKYLEAENEFLKKLEQKEREAIWKANSRKKKNSN